MNKIFFYEKPFEHYITKYFFSPHELKKIWTELDFIIESETAIGINYLDSRNKHNDEAGVSIESNSGKSRAQKTSKFLNDFYLDFRKDSLIYKFISKKIFDKNYFSPQSTLSQYINNTNTDAILLNFYKDGDFYLKHNDLSVMTNISFLWKEPKSFEGGSLYFPDHDYVFSPENNTNITFPSCINHEVKKIIDIKTNNFIFKRISITTFAAINPKIDRF